MAFRSPGAPVIVPSVVHWKVGHFAAITRALSGRYLVQDAIKKLRAVRAPLAGVVMAQVDGRRYRYYGRGTLPYEYARSYYTGA